MVARVRHEPEAVVVVFERDGEEPVRVEAINSEKALIRALILLLAHSKLHAGDCLRIEPAG